MLSAMTEARALSKDHSLIAVIVPEDMAEAMAKLARHQDDVGILERDAMTRQVTLVPVTSAKGLEFDAVVVVEPAAIAGADQRGLRLLYVALTRPIQHLSVVHALPLPRALTD